MSKAVAREGARSDERDAQRLKHPVRELLVRYRVIFKAAWSMRHQMAGPSRLADEAAFLPAALSLQETPVHPAPRRVAWAIMALFLIALIWSFVSKVDIVAVAPGRIIVSERTKIIQPLETSVIERVWVKDGDHVKTGQVLVELDPTFATADKAGVQEQREFAHGEAIRTRALLQSLGTGQVPDVPETAQEMLRPERLEQLHTQLSSEWQDIRAKAAQLDAQIAQRQAEMATVRQTIAKLEATLPMARAREQDFKQLVDQGFMSGHATQDKTRERIELERDLSTQQARLAEARASLAASTQSKASWQAETRRTLQDRHAQAQSRYLQLAQDEAKATQREKLTQLTASVDGVVQQLAVHTLGGVVTEAQALMVIVPDAAQVMAEVTLENKDIGFVSQGQDASIKLETFSYTRYGAVPATVKWVTPDAVNDEKRGAIFPVTLVLNQASINVDGKWVRLSPGMSLTAEIKTGKRRVIEYLLSPIQKAGQESLRER
jgi:hemolysin D